MKMEHQSAENQLNQKKENLARAVESLQCEWKEATETRERVIEQVQTLEADVSALEQLQETAERLAKELETAKEALIEKANVLLSLARDFHRSAEELKAANDLEEETLVQPAREELKSLEDQKEHLVLTMTSLREKIQLLEEEDRKYNEEQAILGEQLAAEYENNQDIVASRKAEQESIKQLMEDEKTNFACDVEANLGLSAGLDEKIKYYQQSIDDVKAAYIAAILKRQDELRTEHQKHLEIETMKLQMYERAIAIMAESDEKVKVLRETKTFMVKVHYVPSISSKKRPRDFMSQ
jgi:hypothetical protein